MVLYQNESNTSFFSLKVSLKQKLELSFQKHLRRRSIASRERAETSISSDRWMHLWSGRRMSDEKFCPNFPTCTTPTSRRYWAPDGKRWAPSKSSRTTRSSPNWARSTWKSTLTTSTNHDRSEPVFTTGRKCAFPNIRLIYEFLQQFRKKIEGFDATKTNRDDRSPVEWVTGWFTLPPVCTWLTQVVEL